MLSFKQFINEKWADYKPLASRAIKPPAQYDTDYFDKKMTAGHYVNDEGKPFAYKHELVPKKQIVSRVEDILPKSDDVIHRGVSHEEYENILKSGVIKSKGKGNFPEQEGLTYYSTDPAAAGAYSSYFAASRNRPTPDRPAYVISIKKPHSSRIRHVPGVGEHEVGIEGDIPVSEIVSVHRGSVIDYTPPKKDLDLRSVGNVKSNKEWKKRKRSLGSSSMSAMSQLHWEKIK